MALGLTVEGFERAVEVGWGGHAVVFRAWQTAQQREVAIKVLSVAPTPDTLERFEQECAAIGSLSGHPNVVVVHAVGATDDGRPFIVMEYLHGGSLADRVRGRGPMPWPEVAEVGIKLAGALHTAHLAGVLHRDVKPENVLVSRFGKPKLGDFGVARLQGGPATGSTGLVGSLPHAAPEVLAGGAPTVASDVYSLGSTLYTLLAGQPPFPVDAEGLLPLIERVSTQPPPDLRPRGVPEEVCRVVEQALAKDPGDRQPTAEDVGRQLQAALDHADLAVPALTVEAPAPPPPAERRRPHRHVAAATVVAASLAVLASAIVMMRASPGSGPPAARAPTTTGAAATGGGGTVAIATEGDPACADWLAVCAGQAWGTWTMYAATMPRVHDIDAQGRFQPTELLARPPTLDVGPPQRVTYEIRADAVWSDGRPITAHDFRYSWEQILNAPDVRERAGYDHIARIDDSNPKVAVLTFGEPYGAWRELFGIRPALLPSHLLEGKDRPALMKDGYRWSAGPWLVDHWTRGSEIKLVPNPRYWGTRPRLDAVVFRIGLNGAALVSALRTGQVHAAYVPFDLTLADQIRQNPDVRLIPRETLGISGTWLNTEKPLLASRSVRQALVYAIDRDELVKERIGEALPDVQVLQALLPRALSEFYVPAFARYSRDLAKVDELMRAEGWARGPDGIWAKDDQRAALEFTTTAPRGRDLLLNQWKEAGFDVSSRQAPGARLFSELLPRGEYDMVGTGLDAITDAGLCFLLCSYRIPTPANNYSGLNTPRIRSAVLDELWSAVDRELDDSRRAELVRQGLEELAREVPIIPLTPSVRALVVSNRIGGRVETNLGMGPFLTTNEWFLQ